MQTQAEEPTNITEQLGTIPTTFRRWNEEARLLDADSLFLAATVASAPVVRELEVHDAVELNSYTHF